MTISSQTLISAHDISLTRRGKSVLDKVSFELQQAEFLIIIGPNGAGKSSLIKVLLGPDAFILTFSATCRYRFVCDMELY
jgi:ABC-type Mn2+/Zn2+ transport system ATPase subunit